MNSPHLLLAGSNPRRIHQNLSGILDQASIDEINKEIKKNCVQLFDLGMKHFHFARRQPSRQWRQTISRLYFASYCISRSIRLGVKGEYSQEVKDHSKIGNLPKDFPNQSTYANRLGVLRDDRNLADYDHTATQRDLIISRQDALVLVQDFVSDARPYLISRGIPV